jgi:hypothetical protein
MTQDKDKIQRAADALEALGAASDGPAQEPASEAPVESAAPSAPAEPPVAAAPGKEAPSGPSNPQVGREVDRHPLKVRLLRSGTGGPAAPKAPSKPRPAPPPKLSPLERARLNRKIALRRTVIPILLTTGLVMVLLGIWSVAVLASGSDPLRGEVTFRTRYLARLMLLAWPIAVILLAGTAFLMHEVYTHYQIYGQSQSGEDGND